MILYLLESLTYIDYFGIAFIRDEFRFTVNLDNAVAEVL